MSFQRECTWKDIPRARDAVMGREALLLDDSPLANRNLVHAARSRDVPFYDMTVSFLESHNRQR